MDYKLKYEKYKNKYNKIKMKIGGNILDITQDCILDYIFVNLSIICIDNFKDYKFTRPLQPVIYKLEKTQDEYKCYTVRELIPTQLIFNDDQFDYTSLCENKIKQLCVMSESIYEFHNDEEYTQQINNILNKKNNFIHELINISNNESELYNIFNKYLYIPYYKIMINISIASTPAYDDNIVKTTKNYKIDILKDIQIDKYINNYNMDLNIYFVKNPLNVQLMNMLNVIDDNTTTIKKLKDENKQLE